MKSTLFKLSSFVFCLLFANSVWAFDSSDAFNTITFSYVDQANVNQIINFSDSQRSNTTSITLSVDAKDGGGRPTHTLDGTPSTYSSQFDVSRIRIHAFNSSGVSIGTVTTTTNLMNWGSSSNPGWSTGPGDNQHDWVTPTATLNDSDITGGFAAVAYVRVYLISDEGSYWAGNYGVQYRAPTLTANGGSQNLLYNPEFGIAPNSVKAQGWATSYSSYSNCGVTSGNQICVTNETNVTANMSDTTTGYDANGGTTSGQAGGYDAQLSTSTADSAEAGNGYTDSSSPPAPSYSSEPTSQQLQDRTDARAVTGSGIYIQQSGDNLDIDINQAGQDQLIAGTSSTSNGLVDASVVGDYNTVNVKQGHEFGISTDNVLLFGINGNHNSLTVEQGNTTTDEGGHRAVVDVTGGYNTINLYQYDGGQTGDHFAKIVIGGDDNSVTSHQRDNGDKMLFLNITGDDNAITTNQKGTGEHFLDITAGSNQTISVTQENSGSHSATIDMSGYSSGLTLNQNSTSDQTYSINQNCLTSTGCGTTTVTQQ